MASATDPDAMMDGGMKRELDLLFDSLMQADAQTSEASEASESKKEEESEKEDPSDTDAITSASFQYALEALGLNPSPDEVAAILAEVGVEPGQSITRAHFHDMVERNSEHDVGLHVVAGLDGGTTPTTTAAAADTSQDSTEGLKRLQSKGSVAMIEPHKISAHSDMYWVEFRKEGWADFPKGFRIDPHNFVIEADVPVSLHALGGGRLSTGDVLVMLDAKGIDKRLPAEAVMGAIKKRMAANGTVHLKFRRGKDHADYKGEYFVALHEVPPLGEIEDGEVLGPIPLGGLADNEGIEAGDTLMAINNEAVAEFHLGTTQFKSMCDAGLARDGSLTLHLRHSEHNVEAHHDALHPGLHKAGFILCGGGCCRSGRNPTATVEEDNAIRSLADAV